MTEPKPRSPLRGPDRAAAVEQARKAYAGGESIRGVADLLGVSYGRARDLVVESGVDLRTRGGANRTKRGDA